MTNETFLPFQLTHGRLFDSAGEFPSRLSAWQNDTLDLPDEGTHFGFVHENSATLEAPAGNFSLTPGMYFAVPSNCRIGGLGQGIVITRLSFRGVFMIGGPIEPAGRLRYINGCTDSLLIPPQMFGDPCLNALYFPAHVSQSEHTHPSIRIGLVARGNGECHTPGAIHQLSPGLGFVINANCRHNFSTANSELVVIAYHPDSDFGPTHEVHPMINRTILYHPNKK